MSKSLYVRLAERHGGRRRGELSRRDLLQATLAASAGALLSGPAWGLRRPRRPQGMRVCVVGAGFSGLACAHELLAAGYDVTVVDARDRVGGRVLSFRDWIPGRTVEGGGELIGSNHPTWVAYADKFGLEFLDVTEDEESMAPISVGGRLLSEDESNELWEALDEATQALNADAAKVDPDQPWTSPGAAELDMRSVAQWIEASPASTACKQALHTVMAADNGAATDRQSYLAMLAQVAGGGIEAYWSDSEVYRCKGGNQQLAEKLAESIGAARIALKLPVTKIAARGGLVTVVCADGREIEVDDVVLAVPPSTWSSIQIDPALPRALAPQMGTNVKYLAHVKTKFWKELGRAADSLSDGQSSMTWDGTDNQGGDAPAALVSFSGGPAAERCLAPADRAGVDAAYAKELEDLYPGFAENLVEARFMSWPKERWTRAGYSFPAPGEVMRCGPLLRKGHGPVHFAGEHCSYAFVGYMEGALNSGAALAARLAERDAVLVK